MGFDGSVARSHLLTDTKSKPEKRGRVVSMDNVLVIAFVMRATRRLRREASVSDEIRSKLQMPARYLDAGFR